MDVDGGLKEAVRENKQGRTELLILYHHVGRVNVIRSLHARERREPHSGTLR